MQLHIVGDFFVSVERETRQAGGCGIPHSWLSVKKQVSGQVHILNNTPLIISFLDGTEEAINWYNPNNPSEILHTMDLVEVLVLRESKENSFSSVAKLVRFCVYNLKRAKTDSSKESRAEVLQYLHKDIELRKLIAIYVLKISEDKVMKPKALQELLEYSITSKMLNINLNNLRKIPKELENGNAKNTHTQKNDNTTQPKDNLDPHPSTRKDFLEILSAPKQSLATAENVFNRIRYLDASFPEFSHVYNKIINDPKNQNGDYLINFLVRMATYTDSSNDKLNNLIPELKKILESK